MKIDHAVGKDFIDRTQKNTYHKRKINILHYIKVNTIKGEKSH